MNNEYILYSIPGCPNCKMLQDLMDDEGVKYTKISDEKELEKKDFRSFPMLEIRKFLNYSDACDLILGGM